MPTPREKFQTLLRKLFQFDCAELDFGIYRILNHKRAAIEQFIQRDLLDGVAKVLGSGAIKDEANLRAQFEEVTAEIHAALDDEDEGISAIDAEGQLAPQFHKGKLGKKYLDLQSRLRGARSSPETEAAIFNHLHAFFSRYYDEGDFMSLRRYSKRDKYAIPYNGEEVHLHWANANQYYIKTGENFTDYSYRHGGWTVQFKLRNADIEQNNVKGAKRFFVPRVADVTLEKQTLTVPFEYRPLAAEEEARFTGQGVQEKILTEASPLISAAAKAEPDAFAALAHEKRRNADGEPVSLLDHHLRTYTRKNSSDFFIHKDLRGFLERELDFYLKNEVLNLDEVEAGGEARAEGWFQMLRAIKALGRRIIAFVAQIEDFQKRLFEKKKFVTEVHYCATLDRVPAALYPEIAKNKAQIAEWKRLFHIHEIERDTTQPGFSEPVKVEFLKANPSLVLDTQFFDLEFSNRLLESMTNLDEGTSGWLIHADNFQAISLINDRFAGEIATMYLDPPYNTDAEPIVYKNDYKSSSWCALIENRLTVARRLLSRSGLACITIDDYEAKELGFIVERIFGRGSVAATVSIRSNPSGRPTPTGFGQSHEYALFVRSSAEAKFSKLPRTQAQMKRYKQEDDDGNFMWELFRKRGSGSERKDRRTLYYPIYAAPSGLRIPKMQWDNQKRDWIVLEEPNKDETVFWPTDEAGVERRWRGAPESVRANPGDFRIQSKANGVTNVYYKYRPDQEGVIPTTSWIDPRYSATEHGTGVIKDLFSDYKIFDYPKSVFAVEDCIWVAGMDADTGTCLDFFAGSGTTAHACINLNRKDGGERKFVLVEAGSHFDRVTKPRVLKVVYSDSWSDGRPLSRTGSSHFIKYLRLESYEDALDNIAFDDAEPQALLALDDYVLGYMLDFETRESATLLNVKALDAPFDYKLRRHGRDEPLPVDLPETFNYLIGLHVESRRALAHGGTKYLVYRGKAGGRATAVVWRTTRGWKQKDYEADRTFIAKQNLTEDAEDIYVNGDSFVEGAQSLDPVFKRLMFE